MGDQRPYGMLGLVFNKVKPYFLVVSVQMAFSGMYIITVVSFNRGMSRYVLIVYRHVAATLAITPFALVLERKIRPKMTISIFLKIMVLGFLEPIVDQNLTYLGLKYTSATFTSALLNIVPAITFVIAIILRLECVKIKEVRSQAKVIGTLVSLAGALVMTLYKGPIIDLIWSRKTSHHGNSSDSSDKHWVTGTLMILVGCCAWSCFYILQSVTVKTYPAELSLASLICFLGMVQSAALALVMEHQPGAWSVGWDSGLLAPVYSGVFCSGITYYVQGLVMKERGPVFVTAFNPLCMICVAVLGSFILAEKIHLGSVIGAIIIAVGLYSVVWGKSKDHLGTVTPTIEKGVACELPITSTDGTKLVISGNEDSDEHVGMSKIPAMMPILQK